jgi:hypothetical protein
MSLFLLFRSFNKNKRAPQTRGMRRLHLDPSICPNPPSVGKDPCENELLAQIKLDLQSAADDLGSPVIPNGSGPPAHQLQRERCDKVCSSKSGPARNPEDCRQSALVNADKGGGRNGGQSEAKRVRTAKAISSNQHLLIFRRQTEGIQLSESKHSLSEIHVDVWILTTSCGSLAHKEGMPG